jgi:hypothetical protein
MSKKPKPKWGWSGAGSFPPFPFSDEDFVLIAESLGLEKIEPEFQERLIQAVYDYYPNHASLDNRPRPNNIKAALEVIQSETKKFAKMLHSIDSATHDVLVRTDIHQKRLLSDPHIRPRAARTHRRNDIHQKKLPTDPSENGLDTAWPIDNINDTIEQCRQNTKKINLISRKALIFMDEQFKDTGGPSIKLSGMRSLLLSLKDIFEDMTGKKATAPSINTVGKYFHFAKTVIQCGLKDIEDPIHDSALTAQIQILFRRKSKQ